MKKIIFISIVVIVFQGCTSYPKNFTYRFKKENTGLEQLIDINGCYVSQLGCDSTFYSIYRFFSDGSFMIATASRITSELMDCFKKTNPSKNCKYPLRGMYKIEGNVIKTQVIRSEGNGCVIFRDYQIFPDKSIVNTSDYVEPQHTNLAYMINYPSFHHNECGKKAVFMSLGRLGYSLMEHP